MSFTRKELTIQQRDQIIGAHLVGAKTAEIIEKLNCKKTTVYNTIKRYEESGSVRSSERTGRPILLDNNQKAIIYTIVKDNRFFSLEEITNELKIRTSTNICTKTVRTYLHEDGYDSRVAAIKPQLSEKNISDRLSWCLARRMWFKQWRHISFSDESRFCLYHNDARKRVWRKIHERYHKDCTVPGVAHGGGSVMVWGCFSWWGVGPLIRITDNLDQDGYVSLLSTHVVPYLKQLEEVHGPHTFQEDNASCHVSKYATWWKTSHSLRFLPWPAHSPDLNPIEHLWDHLDRAVRKLSPPPRTKNELWEALLSEWQNIPLRNLRSLISSMPRRVHAVTKVSGYTTHY